MAFANNAPQGNSNIDWDAMNNEIVNIVGTQNKKKSVVGIISGVIDLGIQKQEDAEVEFLGTPEEEAKIISEKPNTYFKTGTIYKNGKQVSARLKCWPVKAAQAFAFTVDFPQFIVDKSKYLTGESNPAPLRLVLNGEFNKTLARVYPLSWEMLPSKQFSMKRNSLPYKLAVATDLVIDGQEFLPQNLPQLVGRAAQFEIQVYLQEVGDRKYLHEKIKFSGVIPEGLPIPSIDKSHLYTVEFGVENDPVAIKNLRESIVNTIKQANNYEGDIIQKQIDEHRPKRDTNANVSKSDESAALPAHVTEQVPDNAKPAGPQSAYDDFDDEPF